MAAPVRALFAAALAATILAGLTGCGSEPAPLATAQSSDPTTSASGAPAGASDVLGRYITDMKTYVACLRAHGLPNTPDPDQYGLVMLDTRTLGSRSEIDAARLACRSAAVPMPAEVHALLDRRNAEQVTPAEKRIHERYAECMQANGAPDFPDPLPNGMTSDKPWNQTSAGARRATEACASIIGDPGDQGPGVG